MGEHQKRQQLTESPASGDGVENGGSLPDIFEQPTGLAARPKPEVEVGTLKPGDRIPASGGRVPAPEVAAKGRAAAHQAQQILTEELIEGVATLIRKGNYVDRACAMAGISGSVFKKWLRIGGKINRKAQHRGISIEEMADGDPDLILRAKFARACMKASAAAEDRDVGRIDKHADDDWRAAAWRLERRFPKRRGQRKLEVSGPDGGPLQWQVLVAHKEVKDKDE